MVAASVLVAGGGALGTHCNVSSGQIASGIRCEPSELQYATRTRVRRSLAAALGDLARWGDAAPPADAAPRGPAPNGSPDAGPDRPVAGLFRGANREAKRAARRAEKRKAPAAGGDVRVFLIGDSTVRGLFFALVEAAVRSESFDAVWNPNRFKIPST